MFINIFIIIIIINADLVFVLSRFDTGFWHTRTQNPAKGSMNLLLYLQYQTALWYYM